MAFVISRRPDLVPSPNAVGPVGTVGRFAIAGLMGALAVAAIVAPFKSEHPDGLDAVSQKLEFDKLETQRPALILDDYAVPVPEVLWWPGLPVSIAGLLGTLVVFAGAAVLEGVTRRSMATVPPTAAIASPLSNFFVAGNASDRGGVRPAVVDADGDNKADVVVGSGEGSVSGVRVYLGKNFGGAEPSTVQTLDPFGSAVLADGVFVG